MFFPFPAFLKIELQAAYFIRAGWELIALGYSQICEGFLPPQGRCSLMETEIKY